MDSSTTKPKRWQLILVLSLIFAIFVANNVATLTMSGLMKQHPTWLILLNPITRNLLFVAPQVDWLPYFLLAVPRRMLPHPLWFFIGRWYGQKGIDWVTKRSPDIGAMFEWLERHFPAFGWLICLVFPHPLVCTMAGASKMKFTRFFGYCLAGIMFFVSVAYFLGDWLSPLTKPVVNFADHNKWPIIAITLVLMVASYFLNRQQGRPSKFESVEKMERELEDRD